ncbi:unnamed protein product, partial [Lactuca virosa]
MSSSKKPSFYWRRNTQFIGYESKLSRPPSRSLFNRTRSDNQKEEIYGEIISRAPSRSFVNRTRSDRHNEKLDGAIALSLVSRVPSKSL